MVTFWPRVLCIYEQVAQHQGYIKVNWSKVNKHMEEAKKKVEQEARRQGPHALDNVSRNLHSAFLFILIRPKKKSCV